MKSTEYLSLCQLAAVPSSSCLTVEPCHHIVASVYNDFTDESLNNALFSWPVVSSHIAYVPLSTCYTMQLLLSADVPLHE